MQTFNQNVLQEIENFDLPKYSEIPNVGLFLEQTTKYISEYLNPLSESICLTGSMISNYVKKGIIKNPVKKQYARDEIAYLFFIAISKSVLSLENIQELLLIQREKFSCEQCYELFRTEFKKTLLQVFELQAENSIFANDSNEYALLKNTIITVCHKIYLDKYFDSTKKS